MSLRDIAILINIIDEKIELGLEIDTSIPEIFEDKAKSSNLIFSSGIDFIYEFFKFENKIKSNFSKKIFEKIDNKNFLNKYARNFADKGLIF